MEKPISQDEAFALALAFYNRECEGVLFSLERPGKTDPAETDPAETDPAETDLSKKDGGCFRTFEKFTQQGSDCAYKAVLAFTTVSDKAWDDLRVSWETTGSLAGLRLVADNILCMSLLIEKGGMAGTAVIDALKKEDIEEDGKIITKEEWEKTKLWLRGSEDFRSLVTSWSQGLPSGLTLAFARAVTASPELEIPPPFESLQPEEHIYQHVDEVLRSPLLKEDALEALPIVLEWSRKVARLNKREIEEGQEHQTALWLSSAQGMVGFMRLLLDHVDVDVNSGQGRALRWAAGKGKKDAVDFLLSRQADPYLRNDQGDTSIVLAREAGYPEISMGIEAYALRYAAPSERGRARRTTLPPTR